MDRWDLLALVGVVLLGTGLALLAPWLGISVAGALLLAAGIYAGEHYGRADAERRREG